MLPPDPQDKQVQLELPLDLLCRLLREGSLVASDVHYLNNQSSLAGRTAVKNSLFPKRGV